MIELIVDDGNKGRPNRYKIFSDKYKEFGCFNAPHMFRERVTILEYADSIVDEAALANIKSPRDTATETINELVSEDIMIEIPQLAKEFSETSNILFKGSTLKKTLSRILTNIWL